MLKKKIYLFGSTGHLGAYLKKIIEENRFEIYCPNREDIKNILSGNSKNKYSNSYIINLAAIVGNYKSSIDKKKLFEINSIFPLYLANICKFKKSWIKKILLF